MCVCVCVMKCVVPSSERMVSTRCSQVVYCGSETTAECQTNNTMHIWLVNFKWFSVHFVPIQCMHTDTIMFDAHGTRTYPVMSLVFTT